MILFMIFGIKEKSRLYYNVLLAIAANILVLLMTGFVVQGHKYIYLLNIIGFYHIAVVMHHSRLWFVMVYFVPNNTSVR